MNLTPAKVFSLLQLIVDRCGDAGVLLERMTESVNAARTCGAGALDAIAESTKVFVKRAGQASLAVLVGNLPKIWRPSSMSS